MLELKAAVARAHAGALVLAGAVVANSVLFIPLHTNTAGFSFHDVAVIFTAGQVTRIALPLVFTIPSIARIMDLTGFRLCSWLAIIFTGSFNLCALDSEAAFLANAFTLAVGYQKAVDQTLACAILMEEQGIAISLAEASFTAGMCLSTLLTGVAYATGGLSHVLMMQALFSILGAVLTTLTLIKEHRRRRAPSARKEVASEPTVIDCATAMSLEPRFSWPAGISEAGSRTGSEVASQRVSEVASQSASATTKDARGSLSLSPRSWQLHFAAACAGVSVQNCSVVINFALYPIYFEEQYGTRLAVTSAVTFASYTASAVLMAVAATDAALVAYAAFTRCLQMTCRPFCCSRSRLGAGPTLGPLMLTTSTFLLSLVCAVTDLEMVALLGQWALGMSYAFGMAACSHLIGALSGGDKERFQRLTVISGSFFSASALLGFAVALSLYEELGSHWIFYGCIACLVVLMVFLVAVTMTASTSGAATEGGRKSCDERPTAGREGDGCVRPASTGSAVADEGPSSTPVPLAPHAGTEAETVECI